VRVIPAIDLLDGNAVRLRKGVRADATVYSAEPWTLVDSFVAAGAERVHVVDLDGAFGSTGAPRPALDRILTHARGRVAVQLGGGLRTRAAVDAALGAGAAFAVLGTAAINDPALVEHLCRAHSGRIIVAVDARDGKVAVDGWVKTSTIDAETLGRHAAAWGAAALLYTDIARDGMGSGPNVAATAALARAVGADTPVIASGGVGSLADVRALASAGVPMAIVGRALYDGRFTLAEAIAAAAETTC
jgi:phosphoribosylformimino-5-aminoimidazole carboxamide ribotide isomerase